MCSSVSSSMPQPVSIKSSATICFEILTELRKIGQDLDGQGVLLRVNPDIARALKEEESAVLRELRELHRLAEADPKLNIVPGHDAVRVDRLTTAGVLVKGFLPSAAPK